MTVRDKSILECPEKMCEYCCNFDKENIGMDGMALCKLTMTLAYAEDYGGNCMFYNVPKEQIIVPPCKVGDTVWFETYKKNATVCIGIQPHIVDRIDVNCVCDTKNVISTSLPSWMFGKTVFLSREDAEKALKERSEGK